MQTENYLVR